MSRRGNILLVILVAVGVLAVSVGGYFWWSAYVKTSADKQNFAPNYYKQIPDSKPKVATPSADQIGNWKTYVNQEYGYTFDYQAGWIIQEANDRGQTSISVLNSKNDKLLSIGHLPGWGCTEPPPRTPNVFVIGDQTLRWSDTCGTKNYYFGLVTPSGKKLDIAIYFIGSPEEEDARKLLKSLQGVKISEDVLKLSRDLGL